MNSIRLHRLGSDPEFLFARIRELEPNIIGANQVITENKALGLTTFIGVDAHAATAELRPPPAHNIRRHVADVASGIMSTAEHLQKRKDMQDVVLLAKPFVGGEPLGGHIHVSFFYDNAVMREIVNTYGMNYFGKMVGADHNLPPVPRKGAKLPEGLLQAFNDLAVGLAIPTPDNFVHTMNWLLEPFEGTVQVWHHRRQRNAKYGLALDSQIRWMDGKRPNRPHFDSYAYLHYEYRTPSTWMQHPWLAYAYLALAKLTCLNWRTISDLALSTAGLEESARLRKNLGGSNEQRPHVTRVFDQRINGLLGGTSRVRRSADLSDLERSIDMCMTHRLKWLDLNVPIDVATWSHLVMKEGG